MKPIESVGIGLLYYNKGLQQFERALYDAMETLKASGLVAAASSSYRTAPGGLRASISRPRSSKAG